MTVCVDEVTDAIDGSELDVGNGNAAITFGVLWLSNRPLPLPLMLPLPMLSSLPLQAMPAVAVGMDMQLLAERGFGGCCGGI